MQSQIHPSLHIYIHAYLSVESRSGLLLLNGNPAELQAYDALRNYCTDSYQVSSNLRLTINTNMFYM